MKLFRTFIKEVSDTVKANPSRYKNACPAADPSCMKSNLSGKKERAEYRFAKRKAASRKFRNEEVVVEGTQFDKPRKVFGGEAPKGTLAHDKKHKTGVYAKKITDSLKKKNIKEGYTDDSSMAHELIMHADNDAQLHRSSHQPIIANLKKKVKKGVYDSGKATKLWGYHADRAAQSFAGKHSSTPWHKMFTPAVRKIAAAHWEAHHRDELHEAFTPEEFELIESTTEAELNQMCEGFDERKKDDEKRTFKTHTNGQYSGTFSKKKKKEKPFRDAAVTGKAKDFANEEVEHVDEAGPGSRYLSVVHPKLSKLKKQYDKNEDNNDHSTNALLLAKHFGTPAEHDTAKMHLANRNRLGHGSEEGGRFQYEMSKKYYKRLHSGPIKTEETRTYDSASGQWINELSDKKLTDYMVKAGSQIAAFKYGTTKTITQSPLNNGRVAGKRIAAFRKVTAKVWNKSVNEPKVVDKKLKDVDEEVVNELSKKTLGNYIKKASSKRADNALVQGINMQSLSGEVGRRVDALHAKKDQKRERGIGVAVKKLTK